MKGRGVVAWLVDAAAVAGAWGILLVAENVALGFLEREQFSAAWEISLARHTVVPMAFAALAPLSLVFVGAWRTARRAASGEQVAGRVLALAGAVAGAGEALSISGGRHFASWTVRGAFVMVLAGLAVLVGGWLVPRVAALAQHPTWLAAVGLVLTVGAWLADNYVLPRLYPGFHAAMLLGSLTGASLVAFGFRAGAQPTTLSRLAAAAVAVGVVYCAVGTPDALAQLDRAANLKVALVEHAPLLGRAVVAAARLRSATYNEPDTPGASAPATGEVARSLDWSGHDLVLFSVDALRADHVSAYGYPRATTPNIDALARAGALFEHAYCPTPHTSYSVTSMLTGKYLRPLLALGLGEDSETWPQTLQRYGWRTAAFYPPAVFFIDTSRFERFETMHLGFEYAKVEFADPALREGQVAAYLQAASPEAPLFLWVHFFEPHEPYVLHPSHLFQGGSSPDLDAYDSEVATADEGIGRIVRLVQARRPGAIFMVTADHGEEFGEHGGRYHGTTVYEEQVRVPMVVSGPKVRGGLRVASVVQTIDLMPTTLSALGIPRPARLRGRDLGPLLAGGHTAADPGFAFSETDDYALIATGDDRLVCHRRAAACAMYHPSTDPDERSDHATDSADRVDVLRAMLRSTERDHGRYETSGVPPWPEALRRGLQGEGEVALDVASLLDDADVRIRRKAAEVCYQLRNTATAPAVRRALAHDEDDGVRRWLALALTRMDEPGGRQPVEELLTGPDRDWRRWAALALAERGESAGCDELAAWWSDALPPARTEETSALQPQVALEKAFAEQLLAAMGRGRCRGAVPGLLRSLTDVRIRSGVADALGAIRDGRARAPLLAAFAAEPYVTVQPHEARALLALGARDWSVEGAPAQAVQLELSPPSSPNSLKLLVLLSDATASLEARADGALLAPTPRGTEVRTLGLARPAGKRVRLELQTSTGGVSAAWLVADRNHRAGTGPLD
jgi:HEAT repeat protein